MRLYPKRTGQQARLLRPQLSPDERRLPIDFSVNPVFIGHLHSGHGHFTVKVTYGLEMTAILESDISFAILEA